MPLFYFQRFCINYHPRNTTFGRFYFTRIMTFYSFLNILCRTNIVSIQLRTLKNINKKHSIPHRLFPPKAEPRSKRWRDRPVKPLRHLSTYLTLNYFEYSVFIYNYYQLSLLLISYMPQIL